VGAVGDNSTGISGVSWNVTLIPLQVVGHGALQTNPITQAIQYATQNSIHILNLSGGGTADYPPLEQAISQYPGLFVCSAGNQNRNNDNPATPYYPANYPLNNLIAVGAINSSGTRWVDSPDSGSNYGASKVDIFAPGVGILGTYPESICDLGLSDCEATINTIHHSYFYKRHTYYCRNGEMVLSDSQLFHIRHLFGM